MKRCEPQNRVWIGGMALLILNIMVRAAGGTIHGVITDGSTGMALPAANIRIEGTQIGAASSLDGEYQILNVPHGTFNLLVTYIGYQKKSIEVNVIANQRVRMDVMLEHATVQGREVVVTAQAAGQQAAINQQINAISIKNVVSSARIQELPDATAAESIGRLPGVSISRSGGEANQVSIRGLTAKIQVDGVTMKSTELGGGAVDISMISPNMLSGIEVTKAVTADMEADNLGGTVNMTLGEAQDGLYTDFLAQHGYDSDEESFGNYKFSAGVSNRFLNNKLGAYVTGYVEQRNRGTEILNPSFEEDRTVAEELRDTRILFNGMSWTDRAEVRNRFGGTLVLDYRLPGGVLKLTNFGSRMDRDILIYNQNHQGGQSITKSGQNYQDQLVNSLYGEFNVLSGVLDFTASHSYARRDQPEERGINAYAHFEMDWFVLPPQKRSDENLNYMDYIFYSTDAQRDLTRMQWSQVTRNAYFTKEREYAAKLNYKVPFTVGDFTSGFVKIGGLYKHNNRENARDNQRIGVNGNEDPPVWKWLIEKRPDVFVNRHHNGKITVPDAFGNDFDNSKFFDGKYNLTPFMSHEIFDMAHDYLWPIFDNSDQYLTEVHANAFSNDQRGISAIKAGYAMTDLRMWDNKIQFTPGVRYERVDYKYTGWQTVVSLGDYVKHWGPDDVTEATATHYNEHWFPMINLKVKPGKWFDVRAAYTELAQRHGYQHLVPYSIERVTANRLDVGNPYLKPQISENWDLYVTTYGNKLGLLSAGVFHKKIKNGLRITDWYLATVERAQEWGLDERYKGDTYYIPANKRYPGFSKGIELEWQTNFWYLPFPFNGLVLNANYTHQINDGKTPYFIYETKTISIRPPVFETTQTDTFYATHQTRNLVNVSLGYDYKGFAGYVSYFYQGRSVQNFDPKEYLNVWVFPYSRVDIKIRQKLPVKGLELFFDANNITESGDRTYRHSEPYIEYEEYWGRTYNWGLRYRM